MVLLPMILIKLFLVIIGGIATLRVAARMPSVQLLFSFQAIQS